MGFRLFIMKTQTRRPYVLVMLPGEGITNKPRCGRTEYRTTPPVRHSVGPPLTQVVYLQLFTF